MKTRQHSYMKKLICAALFAVTAASLSAQVTNNNQYTTVSPYSQFGLGLIRDQSQGFNKGMNGVGIGGREHNMVNTLNPASYSSMDSLTFVFDAGASGQMTRFQENGKKINANSAAFDYMVAGFRAFKHVGVSLGILPYSNIGYNYSSKENVGSTDVTYTNTYYGTGGIHQAFLGVGWEPIKGVSIGVNGGYMWGKLDKTVSNIYSDAAANVLAKYYKTSISNYMLDFGLQFSTKLSKKDQLTLGLTYGFGHSIKADMESQIVSTNSQTGVSDTATVTMNDAFKLPHTFGAGLMWNHRNSWRVGFDFTLQKWADVGYPELVTAGNQTVFALNNNYYQDRKKFNLGIDYCVDENSNKYLNRVHYRMGVSYATPYLNINGKDGPKEISVTAGLGIPIINGWNNRSVLNISAQWVHNAADGMLTENVFRINLGLTFNERWFMKWKVN